MGSQQVFDCNYQLINLSSAEYEFLQGCVPLGQGCGARGATGPYKVVGRVLGEILADVEIGLDEVRSILSKQLILLTPKL